MWEHPIPASTRNQHSPAWPSYQDPGSTPLLTPRGPQGLRMGLGGACGRRGPASPGTRAAALGLISHRPQAGHRRPASLCLPACGLLPVRSKNHCSTKEEDTHPAVSQPGRVSPRTTPQGQLLRDATQGHLPCSQPLGPHLSLRDAGRRWSCICPQNGLRWHCPLHRHCPGRPSSPCGPWGQASLGPCS